MLETQRHILESLRGHFALGTDARVGALPELSDGVPSPPPRVRIGAPQRQRTVLLIDDDDQARQQAETALEAAQISVRTAADGQGAIEAIASEKPDVIVLEPAFGGSMEGRDVINMIKATMEWLDIPIVLYTHVPIENEQEARTIHGADDFVTKGPGAAETLVARVIRILQWSTDASA